MGVCEGEVGSAEGEVQGQLPPEQDRGGEIAESAGNCPLCVWVDAMPAVGKVQYFLRHAQVVLTHQVGAHGSITIMCYNTCMYNMFVYSVRVHVHLMHKFTHVQYMYKKLVHAHTCTCTCVYMLQGPNWDA